MPIRVLMLAGLGALLHGGGTVAQEAVPGDQRCWHGSQSYSEGGVVRVGGTYYGCGAGSQWQEVTGGYANCLYADRSYATGALVAVERQVIRCTASGAWEVAAAAE